MTPSLRRFQMCELVVLVDHLEGHARHTLPDAAHFIRGWELAADAAERRAVADGLVLLRGDILRLQPALEELSLNLRIWR